MFHIRKKKKLVKTKSPLWQQLPKAIVYLSDVFIFLMVATWIFYIVNGTFAGWYELIVVQSTCIFTDLKDACTIPLTAGGVVWLIRCAVNHLNAAKNGEMLKYDFPNLDEDGNIVEDGSEMFPIVDMDDADAIDPDLEEDDGDFEDEHEEPVTESKELDEVEDEGEIIDIDDDEEEFEDTTIDEDDIDPDSDPDVDVNGVAG